MNDALVRVQVDSAYLKLSQTPLARTTTVFGISASKCFLALCMLYIFFNVVPGFYITRMPLDVKIPYKKNEEVYIEKTLNQMYAANALITCFGFISLIAVGFLIMGINCRNSLMVFKSMTCLQLNTLLGRLFPVFIFFSMDDNNLACLMAIILAIDVVLVGLMVIVLGKFIGECRNIRYSNCNPRACYSNTPNPSQCVHSSVNYYTYPTQYATGV